jgi:hypothetical protein
MQMFSEQIVRLCGAGVRIFVGLNDTTEAVSDPRTLIVFVLGTIISLAEKHHPGGTGPPEARESPRVQFA